MKGKGKLPAVEGDAEMADAGDQGQSEQLVPQLVSQQLASYATVLLPGLACMLVRLCRVPSSTGLCPLSPELMGCSDCCAGALAGSGAAKEAADKKELTLKSDPTDGLPHAAEKLLLHTLHLFDQMTQARVLLKSPTDANLLVVPMPGAAQPDKDSEAAKPESVVGKLQVSRSCVSHARGSKPQEASCRLQVNFLWFNKPVGLYALGLSIDKLAT